MRVLYQTEVGENGSIDYELYAKSKQEAIDLGKQLFSNSTSHILVNIGSKPCKYTGSDSIDILQSFSDIIKKMRSLLNDVITYEGFLEKYESLGGFNISLGNTCSFYFRVMGFTLHCVLINNRMQLNTKLAKYENGFGTSVIIKENILYQGI